MRVVLLFVLLAVLNVCNCEEQSEVVAEDISLADSVYNEDFTEAEYTWNVFQNKIVGIGEGYLFAKNESAPRIQNKYWTYSFWVYLTPVLNSEHHTRCVMLKENVVGIFYQNGVFHIAARNQKGTDVVVKFEVKGNIEMEWLHIAIEYTEPILALYLNGEIVLKWEVYLTERASDALFVGKFPGFKGQPIRAFYYDLFAANYPLSQSQVLNRMHSNPPPHLEFTENTFKNQLELDDDIFEITEQYIHNATSLLKETDEEQQNPSLAIEYLYLASLLGNHNALTQLGLIYLKGEVVPGNLSLAWTYFKEGAESGNALAQHYLAFMYSTGILGETNEPEAMKWYAASVVGGSIESELVLASRIWHHETRTNISCVEANLYYMRAARVAKQQYTESGSGVVIEGQYLTDDIHEGNSGEDDSAIAFTKLMADGGNADSQVVMGELYSYGLHGVAVNETEAVKYYRMAAEQGDTVAMNKLATMYIHGIGVEKNLTIALDYLHRATQLGDDGAYNTLGYLYDNGIGVEENQQLALEYFNKSVNLNNSEALTNMAIMYQEGHGTEVNKTMAFQYFKRAKEGGEILAHYYIGNLYIHGEGTTQSCPSAVKAYKTLVLHGTWGKELSKGVSCYIEDNLQCALISYMHAAELGYGVASRNAAWLMKRGTCFVEGELKESSNCAESALHYYKLALTQRLKDPEIPLEIGDAYYYGVGTAVNTSKAFQYYTQAADMKSVQAVYNLGWMHENGIGVDAADLDKAHEYYLRILKVDHYGAYIAVVLTLIKFWVKIALGYADTVALWILSILLLIAVLLKHRILKFNF